jgi:cobalt/nickel transport system permease protein
MLRLTAPRAADDAVSVPALNGLRWLWIGLAALMLATPLGLLAAGSAWGEWKARDFKNPQSRQEIALASQDIAPPRDAPAGFRRLSAVWTAPMPDYAPPFLKSESLGYLCSAMFGSGLLILAWPFFGWVGWATGLLGPRRRPEAVRPR